MPPEAPAQVLVLLARSKPGLSSLPQPRLPDAEPGEESRGLVPLGGRMSAKAKGISVSLVVPVRNEEATLGQLVDSIRGQTRPPDEVILVDGGSDDRTVFLARAVRTG